MSQTSNAVKIESISRLSSLPLVSSAINLAIDGYSRVKSYNRLISATLSGAEQSVIFMASTAKPMIEKLEKPLSFADSIACQGLDKLEEKVPAVKKSPEEIKDETKKLFNESKDQIENMKKYGAGKLQGMKDYGLNKVQSFYTPYFNVFTNSIDTALELTNKAVDHYFPATADEPKPDAEVSKDGQTLVVRMSQLSEKMRRRMFSQLSSKWIPMVFETINNFKSNVFQMVNRKPIEKTE